MHTHSSNPADTAIFKEINRRIKNDPFFANKNHQSNTAIKFALYLILTVSLYCSILFSELKLMVWISYLAFGLVTVLGTFNFSHELSHSTIFKSRKLNHFFYTLSFMIVGAHAEGWKHRHIHAHHHAPNVDGYDPDLDLSQLIRVMPQSNYRWFHRFQHLYAPFSYMLYTLFWILIKDTAIILFKSKRAYQLTPMGFLSFLFQKTFYFSYILVLPVLFSNMNWQLILLSFLSMHLFQSLFLLLTFFMTHHVEHTEYPKINNEGQINTSWFMNQIRSSNDMNPFCPVTTFILGGFNTHIAHHLFPNIHHTKYVKLSAIIYEVLSKNGVRPLYTSYWGGIVAHFRLLKKRSTL